MEKKILQWNEEGRESLRLELKIKEDSIADIEMKAVGCLDFLKLSQKMKSLLKGPIAEIQVPEGSDHSSMIWREIIYQLKNEWQIPVTSTELCHCRRVPTKVVDRSVVYGAHSIEEIRSQTSANTGCGTCREDVLQIIGNRLRQT